jgi:ADP-ribose pyrophosphatase YjhB (NUDIX family)
LKSESKSRKVLASLRIFYSFAIGDNFNRGWMIIFVNDIPVRIFKPGEKPESGRYNYTIDAASEPITQAKLIHHVWVQNVEETHFETLLGLLNSKVPTSLLTLMVSVQNHDLIKDYLKEKFKVVKAAGGLVRKKDKFLMIYRLKKWDLPKGKKEKNENNKQAAVREVEEECNINVKLGAKICTTWHTYTMNKRAMLKKTKWYIMDSVDDSRMKPQVEEDIEEIRWMSPKEVYHALEHSYKSINYVFEQFYEKTEMKSAR